MTDFESCPTGTLAAVALKVDGPQVENGCTFSEAEGERPRFTSMRIAWNEALQAASVEAHRADRAEAALATARAQERERVCIELRPEQWPNEADRNIAYKCVEIIRALTDHVAGPSQPTESTGNGTELASTPAAPIERRKGQRRTENCTACDKTKPRTNPDRRKP